METTAGNIKEEIKALSAFNLSLFQSISTCNGGGKDSLFYLSQFIIMFSDNDQSLSGLWAVIGYKLNLKRQNHITRIIFFKHPQGQSSLIMVKEALFAMPRLSKLSFIWLWEEMLT